MQEPYLLLEERQQVERSTQSSALSHYHAFIDSANCLSVVKQQLNSVCNGLDNLSTSVPELAMTFESFSKDASAVMVQHTANKQLLGEWGMESLTLAVHCSGGMHAHGRQQVISRLVSDWYEGCLH